MLGFCAFRSIRSKRWLSSHKSKATFLIQIPHVFTTLKFISLPIFNFLLFFHFAGWNQIRKPNINPWSDWVRAISHFFFAMDDIDGGRFPDVISIISHWIIMIYILLLQVGCSIVVLIFTGLHWTYPFKLRVLIFVFPNRQNQLYALGRFEKFLNLQRFSLLFLGFLSVISTKFHYSLN